ncbi:MULTISPECIES: signal peptidase I [Bacillaceae]|uniref:Signal peptidase I n=1 Tax=Evansella alkalicola TaxID=745819 RepID=A0ABS6JNK8_9BACI|nr:MULTISPECIES: signal peptidase I [Bacillaceae]MBU9720063.1 signal peptidase I [Bacillus alkalicola]
MNVVFKFFSEIFSWIKALIVAFVIAVLISVFIIQPYTVDGSSMEPSLNGGETSSDRVIAFKAPFLLGNLPDYGEIVIVDSRVDKERTMKDVFLESQAFALLSSRGENDTHTWIKRVIGLPGDKLESKNGLLYRNGELIKEEYTLEEMYIDFSPIVVPEGNVFVMGDNRNASRDSRNVGPIPVENVIGKVVLRYYPFNKIESF